MKLGDGVSTNLSWTAVVVRNTLGTLLQATSDNSCLMIHLTDNKDGTDYSRRQALKNDGLIVVDRDL